jgi:hypothetical protein
MNTENFESAPRPEELQGELKDAVNLVRNAPPPEESQNRAFGRALQWANALPAPSRPSILANRKRWPRWFRWTFLGSATALLVALAGTIFWQAGNPSTSWAEVVKAMQMKPWIHAETTVPAPGPEIKSIKSEFWFSQKHAVFAQSGYACDKYYDRKLHFIDEYQPETKSILRTSVISSSFENTMFTDMEAMFENLLNGDSPFASVTQQIPGSEMVEQTQTDIEVSGRKLIEYRLKLRHIREGQELAPLIIIFHVDRSTNLPTEMIFNRSGKEGSIDKLVYKFDYPAEGPTDIYALGVPLSAKRIDRTVKPELNQLLDAVAKARNDFDPYEAVVIVGTVPVKQMITFQHIWRNGLKFRAESAYITKKDSVADLPLKPVDNLDWCRKYLDKYEHQPIAVCDGKIVYVPEWEKTKAIWENPNVKVKELYKWKEFMRESSFGKGIIMARPTKARDYFVEFYAYPFMQSPRDDLEVEIKPAGPDDPPGTILIEEKFSTKDDHSERAERFLVDPSRGFVTLRHEIDFPTSETPIAQPPKLAGDASKSQPYSSPTPQPIKKQISTTIYEMKDFRKSPRGIWYPTQVRSNRNILSSSAPIANQQGQSYYFYLDFSKDLPDELFQPDSSSKGDK